MRADIFAWFIIAPAAARTVQAVFIVEVEVTGVMVGLTAEAVREEMVEVSMEVVGMVEVESVALRWRSRMVRTS